MRFDLPSIALILAVVLALIGLLAILRAIRSGRELRAALHSLAAERDPKIVFGPLPRFLTQAGRDLSLIADRLKTRERQLADGEFSLKTILESMREGVLITDRDIRIRLANDAFLRLVGVAQSPVGRTVLEVARHHQLHHAILSTLEDGMARRAEWVFQDAGKETRLLDVHVAPLASPKGASPDGAVIVFQNVTELRKLEKVRREFVANVSHEFRTPLSIIQGYIETLAENAWDDPAMIKHALRVMDKHSRRLHLLIDDLLTVSKLEGGAADLHFRKVEVSQMFARALDHLEPKIREAGALIRRDFPDAPLHIHADESKMDQVVWNLLLNALQHRSDAPLEIHVSARQTGEEIMLAITDNGRGIPLADQPHLFERFYKVDKARAPGTGGTGLGLSIVKHIVTAHGGRVEVESIPGQKSTFRVFLPVEPAAHSA